MNPKLIIQNKDGTSQTIRFEHKRLELIAIISRAILQNEVNYVMVMHGDNHTTYKIDVGKTLAEPNKNILVSYSGSRYDYSIGGVSV